MVAAFVGGLQESARAAASASALDVVINEVAWAGNSSTYSQDEWIELYNTTPSTVSLGGWPSVLT